jgi:hypothetical protein
MRLENRWNGGGVTVVLHYIKNYKITEELVYIVVL